MADDTLTELAGKLLAGEHASDAALPDRPDRTFPRSEQLKQLLGLLRGIVLVRREVDCEQTRLALASELAEVRRALISQIAEVRHYAGEAIGPSEAQAVQDADAFLAALPELREMVLLDVQAAFDGDPAAESMEEIILCYPGLEAVFTYRMAHQLLSQRVPLLPRALSEFAHTRTGADIHPGATIGRSFFVDHATGVVIGGTAVIGDRVTVYQGVTLGALSTRGGQSLHGVKRHPTVGNDVVIYPNATVLGGETHIGDRCVVNGGVFLGKSVPPDHTVRAEHPEPRLRPKGSARQNADVWIGEGI